MPTSERYLLCRPRGGLNDTLCRIALCWQYAARFHRTLIIDCWRSSLFGPFSEFFEFRDQRAPTIPAVDEHLLNHLNSLQCRPTGLAGRLDRYVASYDFERGYVDAEDREPTRFTNTYPAQFVDDFPEPLLVYEDSGGGRDSFSLLPSLRLADPIVSAARSALASLQQPYHAVHVRNTDYRTDYRTVFSRIRRRVGDRPLLVCSDDSAVVRYAESFFSGPVLRVSRRAGSADPTGALHREGSQPDPETQRQAAIESLIDLVCLANAQTLYYGPVHSVLESTVLRDTGEVVFRPLGRGWVSGFSLLAQHLCEHKPVLDSLLGVAASRRTPDPGAVVQVDTRGLGRRVLSRVRRHAESVLQGRTSRRP